MVDSKNISVRFPLMCFSKDEEEDKGSGIGDNMLVTGFTFSTIMPLKTGMHVTEYLERSKKRMSIVHETM